MAESKKPVTALEEVLEIEEHCMTRLADSFEASARRWELIVYPSLIAFVLLASYGFWLIYNLTHDIADVAKSVREMTAHVTQDLSDISGTMSEISESASHMRPMQQDIRTMAMHVGEMNSQVSHMQYSMWQLNRNVSAPFNMVDKMIPFGSSRPYGRGNNRVSPPLYPRPPAVYYQQPAAPAQHDAGPGAMPDGASHVNYIPNGTDITPAVVEKKN